MVVAGGDSLPVLRKSQAGKPISVPFESECMLAGLRVPHSHGLVLAGRDNTFAVVADGHTRDFPDVTFEGHQLLTGLQAPHFHDAVLTGGDNAIWIPFTLGGY